MSRERVPSRSLTEEQLRSLLSDRQFREDLLKLLEKVYSHIISSEQIDQIGELIARQLLVWHEDFATYPISVNSTTEQDPSTAAQNLVETAMNNDASLLQLHRFLMAWLLVCDAHRTEVVTARLEGGHIGLNVPTKNLPTQLEDIYGSFDSDSDFDLALEEKALKEGLLRDLIVLQSVYENPVAANMQHNDGKWRSIQEIINKLYRDGEQVAIANPEHLLKRLGDVPFKEMLSELARWRKELDS